MKAFLISAITLIGFFTLLVGISFAVGWINVGYTKTVGKAQRDADREVFEQSQSYVHGKIQELAKHKLEWDKADFDQKQSIEFVIRHQFANVPAEQMPEGLRHFLTTIRGY